MGARASTAFSSTIRDPPTKRSKRLSPTDPCTLRRWSAGEQMVFRATLAQCTRPLRTLTPGVRVQVVDGELQSQRRLPHEPVHRVPGQALLTQPSTTRRADCAVQVCRDSCEVRVLLSNLALLASWRLIASLLIASNLVKTTHDLFDQPVW